MKQIILRNEVPAIAEPCTGRLLFVWALYGCAMALLSHLAGTSQLDQAALWTAGALAGLLLATKEI